MSIPLQYHILEKNEFYLICIKILHETFSSGRIRAHKERFILVGLLPEVN